MKRLKLLTTMAVAVVLCSCAESAVESKIKVPYQKNEYVHVYQPAGATFQGPSTENFTEGVYYDKWLANDHTIIKGNDGYWHMFGLIFPYPMPGRVHEGGAQTFHAVSKSPTFKDAHIDAGWEDKPQVLTRIVTNHSPNMVEKDGVYYMIYGRSSAQLATSTDLYNWTVEGEVFNSDAYGYGDPRDPHILKDGDTYYISYCIENGIAMRSSKDLRNWSEPKIIFQPEEYDPESPSVIHYDDKYYLFVCVWNKHKFKLLDIDDYFPQITNVYVSDNPEGPYQESSLVTTLNGHAPEIFQDEDGDWFISSAQYPYCGISIDKLYWK